MYSVKNKRYPVATRTAIVQALSWGPMTIWGLGKFLTEYRYDTVKWEKIYHYIQALIKDGVVEFVKEGVGQNGLPKKYYGLTDYGRIANIEERELVKKIFSDVPDNLLMEADLAEKPKDKRLRRVRQN